MGSDRQDFIAIPTYNRLPELTACLTCLGEVRGLERFRIFVRDDASTEFDLDALRKLAPNAERIDRNNENMGPGANHVRLF
jgi:GT2 family glycosyltransferase